MGKGFNSNNNQQKNCAAALYSFCDKSFSDGNNLSSNFIFRWTACFFSVVLCTDIFAEILWIDGHTDKNNNENPCEYSTAPKYFNNKKFINKILMLQMVNIHITPSKMHTLSRRKPESHTVHSVNWRENEKSIKSYCEAMNVQVCVCVMYIIYRCVEHDVAMVKVYSMREYVQKCCVFLRRWHNCAHSIGCYAGRSVFAQ